MRCIFTPCHTKGHICYFVTGPSASEPAVFTGDTLFVGGCGKFFEGTGQDMYTSLITNLSVLPPETKVYCGHEYTVSNLNFALSVEPDNLDIHAKMDLSKNQRKKNQPTVPSTIGDEMKFNPFMRVNEPLVQEYVGSTNPVTVMGALRTAKDGFKSK